MATKKWTLDPMHSELQFKVKHLMVSNVTGNFKDFQVEVVSPTGDFTDATVTATVQVASVSTGPADRDKHLVSADFFDAEKYPEMKFVSTGFTRQDDDDFILEGNLTIKDVTRPVKLRAEFGGTVRDPWGNIKSAFSLSGKINRNDWGLSYNAALETGGVLLSEEVRILAEVQMTAVVAEEVKETLEA